MKEKKEYMLKVKFWSNDIVEQDVVLVDVSFLREFDSPIDALEYLAKWVFEYGHNYGDELESAKVYVKHEGRKPEVVGVLFESVFI